VIESPRTNAAMEIQVAALCDSANDYQGKLCLLGAFDTIIATVLPAVHPQCTVALRIVFRKEDEGSHQLRLSFVDEDGAPVVPPLDTSMEVALPPNFFFTARNVILNMQQLQFEREGFYEINLAVDGRNAISIPLQVILAQSAESQP
jgi:uncharacterized protein DUF6941